MDYIGIIGKVMAKVGLNIVIPGSSIVVDVVDVTNSLKKGDYLDAGITSAFAAADVVSLGLASAAKDTGKEAVKGAAQTATKEATKKWGQEAGTLIAKETVRSKAKEATLKAGAKAMADCAKQQTKEQGQEFLKQQTLQIGRETASKIAKDRAATEAFKATTVQATKVLEENTKQCIQTGIVTATEQDISDATGRSLTKTIVNDLGHTVVQNGIKVPAGKDAFETIASAVVTEWTKSAPKEFEKTIINETAYNTTYAAAKSSMRNVRGFQVGISVAGGVINNLTNNE